MWRRWPGLARRLAQILAATGLGAVAVAATLAGMWLGARLRGRVSGPTFRRLFFLGLLAVGIHLGWRGLAA